METSWVRIVDIDDQEGLSRDCDDPSRVEVQLVGGDRVFLPRTMVSAHAGEPLRCGHSFAALRERATAGAVVVPIVQESVAVTKAVVERERVRVLIESTIGDETIDVPLQEESLRVERVEVRRFVDSAEGPRQDGDTTIVPLYEEVLVVEKRLLLREELHITRERQERVERRTVAIRREKAEVQTTMLSAPTVRLEG